MGGEKIAAPSRQMSSLLWGSPGFAIGDGVGGLGDFCFLGEEADGEIERLGVVEGEAELDCAAVPEGASSEAASFCAIGCGPGADAEGGAAPSTFGVDDPRRRTISITMTTLDATMAATAIASRRKFAALGTTRETS